MALLLEGTLRLISRSTNEGVEVGWQLDSDAFGCVDAKQTNTFQHQHKGKDSAWSSPSIFSI